MFGFYSNIGCKRPGGSDIPSCATLYSAVLIFLSFRGRYSCVYSLNKQNVAKHRSQDAAATRAGTRGTVFQIYEVLMWALAICEAYKPHHSQGPCFKHISLSLSEFYNPHYKNRAFALHHGIGGWMLMETGVYYISCMWTSEHILNRNCITCGVLEPPWTRHVYFC